MGFLRRVVTSLICLKSAACGVVAALLSVGLLVADFFLHSVDREEEFFNGSTYGGLTALVSLLIVFRGSNASGCYWEGSRLIHQMTSDWLETASALIAFCRYSDASAHEVKVLKNVLVRLRSLLSASIMGESEGLEMDGDTSPDQLRVLGQKHVFEYELLDIATLDSRALSASARSAWLHELIVDNVKTVVSDIPPPLLSTVFQKLSNGMHACSEASRLVTVELPLAYTATTNFTLVLLTFLCLYVFCSWSFSRVWPVLFAFFFVFTFWALNLTVEELENPFGDEDSDLDMRQAHRELNRRLVALLAETEVGVRTLCVPVDSVQFAIALGSRASLEHQMTQSAKTNARVRHILRAPGQRHSSFSQECPSDGTGTSATLAQVTSSCASLSDADGTRFTHLSADPKSRLGVFTGRDDLGREDSGSVPSLLDPVSGAVSETSTSRAKKTSWRSGMTRAAHEIIVTTEAVFVLLPVELLHFWPVRIIDLHRALGRQAKLGGTRSRTHRRTHNVIARHLSGRKKNSAQRSEMNLTPQVAESRRDEQGLHRGDLSRGHRVVTSQFVDVSRNGCARRWRCHGAVSAHSPLSRGVVVTWVGLKTLSWVSQGEEGKQGKESKGDSQRNGPSRAHKIHLLGHGFCFRFLLSYSVRMSSRNTRG